MYLGLSAPCIQPQRKPQPGCSAVGNEEQVLEDGPPYCAPQTAEVAFHSVEHPSNCPKPPPGIYSISHCLSSRERGLTYSKIKLRTTDIISSISGLHYHFLPFKNGARKSELVARTAIRGAGADGCEAIGQVVVDGPRGLITAHICTPPRAARLDSCVC